MCLKELKSWIKKDKIEGVLMTGVLPDPIFREKIEYIFPKLSRQNLIYDHSPFLL